MTNKVVSLVTKSEQTTCESFITRYLTRLRGIPTEEQPTKIFIIEYTEKPAECNYELLMGGPGEMRPHSLVGILACLQHEVAATNS